MFDSLFPTGLKSENASSGMDLMILAPWVIAMRTPELIFEAATPWHSVGGRRRGEGETAIVEKTAAVIESYGVVQAQIVEAWSNVLAATMMGKMPDAFQFSRAVQDFSDASMEPMAKRVRANYRRLRKSQTTKR